MHALILAALISLGGIDGNPGIQVNPGVLLAHGATGDVTDVGPACSDGACFTDGKVTTGTEIIIFEGTGSDANELRLLSPSANPASDIDITFPSATGTLLNESGALSATKTQCVFLLAPGGASPTTNGAAAGTVDGTNFTYRTLDFDSGATEESADWVFELPANISGTTADVSFVWISNNAACNNGATADVCWAIDCGGFTNDEAFNTGALGGTVNGVTDKCLANGDKMDTASITLTHGISASDTGACRVFRDTDGTNCAGVGDDDLAADASLIAVRVCFETDNVFSGE